jgi:hypothetical protein
MADKKKAVEMNGFKFISMAIKIGESKSNRFDKIAEESKSNIFTKIAENLGSKYEFVSTAADIGDKIKEIMRT